VCGLTAEGEGCMWMLEASSQTALGLMLAGARWSSPHNNSATSMGEWKNENKEGGSSRLNLNVRLGQQDSLILWFFGVQKSTTKTYSLAGARV